MPSNVQNPPPTRTEGRPGKEKRSYASPAKEEVRKRRLNRLVRRNWTRRLVNCFVVWHILALSVWLFAGNDSSALMQTLLPSVRPYLGWTGLMQDWHMFAPNPINLDVTLEAQITYADGHVGLWRLPRPAAMGYAERYRRERFYKYVENINNDEHSDLWPYLARYAAQCSNTNPRCLPTSVTLIRRFRRIPPPGLPFPAYQTKPFFKTVIVPQDLS